MPANDLQPWLQQHRWDVGARIRRLRTQRDISQVALADLAGLDHKSISRYENGRRNLGLDEAAMIARALGVPTWRLLRDD